METCKVYNKKLLASLVNVSLVFSILIVLIPLSMPTAEATIYVIWDDWVVNTPESYQGDTFILYGNLTVQSGYSLTFDNCNLEMAYAANGTGDRIKVDGTFKVLNNSLITTYSTSPDPYEFRIDGTALIENST